MKPFSGRSRTIAESSNQTPVSKEYQPSLLDKFRKKNQPSSFKLTEIIDVDEAFENLHNKNLNLLKPSKIYQTGEPKGLSKFIKGYYEKEIQTTGSQVVSLPLFSTKEANDLNKQGLTTFHPGLIVIGIKALHRKGLNKVALVTIVDQRFSDPKEALVAIYEVSTVNGGGIFYRAPKCHH